MNVAGLDVATCSGLAIMGDDGTIIHAEKHRPKGTTDAEIISGFRHWLRPVLVANKVEHVAIEEPLPTNIERTEIVFSHGLSGPQSRKIKRPMSNMATYRRLYALVGAAEALCFDLNIEFTEVNIREWREFYHGRRSAPKGVANATDWWKDQALARCAQLHRSGIIAQPITSKDAAEAVGIVFWLEGHLKLRKRAMPGELQLTGAAA